MDTELCLIEDPDETGVLLARMLGDGTAEVLTVTPSGRRQRFGDRVLLGAARRPLDDGMARYRSTTVLQPGGYRTDCLLAPHPGDRALLRLERQLSERRWGLGVQVVQTVDGEPPVVHLWLATPAGTDDVELDAVLGATTDDWAHPPAYLDIVARSGGNVALHERRGEQYVSRLLVEN
jgi:hypothetical protein